MCDFKVEMFDREMFTDRLKELRHGLKMSQERMSEQAGLARCTVTAWENEKNMPSVSALWQFCNCFGVSMDWLTGLDVKGGGSCSD